MIKEKSIIKHTELKELMSGNSDFFRPLLQKVVQEVLERINEELKHRTHVIKRSTATPGAMRRNPWKLDRTTPLPEHGAAQRTP